MNLTSVPGEVSQQLSVNLIRKRRIAKIRLLSFPFLNLVDRSWQHGQLKARSWILFVDGMGEHVPGQSIAIWLISAGSAVSNAVLFMGFSHSLLAQSDQRWH